MNTPPVTPARQHPGPVFLIAATGLLLVAAVVTGMLTVLGLSLPPDGKPAAVTWHTVRSADLHPINPEDPLLQEAPYVGGSAVYLLRRPALGDAPPLFHYSPDGKSLEKVELSPDTELVVSIAGPHTNPRRDADWIPVSSPTSNGAPRGTVLWQTSDQKCSDFPPTGPDCSTRIVVSLPHWGSVVTVGAAQSS